MHPRHVFQVRNRSEEVDEFVFVALINFVEGVLVVVLGQSCKFAGRHTTDSGCPRREQFGIVFVDLEGQISKSLARAKTRVRYHQFKRL